MSRPLKFRPEYLADLGVVPDVELAARIGVSKHTIASWRRARQITTRADPADAALSAYRLPRPVLRAIDRIAANERRTRTAVVIDLIEAGLRAR